MGKLGIIIESLIRSLQGNQNVRDVKVDPGGGPNVNAEHFADIGDDSQPLPGDVVALNSDVGTGRETAIGYVDTLNDHKSQPGEKRIYSRSTEGVLIAEQWLQNDGTINTKNYDVSGENPVLLSSISQKPDGTIEIFAEDTITLNTGLAEVILESNGKITSKNNKGSVELAVGGSITIESPDATLNVAANGDIKGNNLLGAFELTPAGSFDVNGLIIDMDGNLFTPGTVQAETIDGGKHVLAKGKELVNHKHTVTTAPGTTSGNL